jgi:hypothetical protein
MIAVAQRFPNGDAASAKVLQSRSPGFRGAVL